MNFLPGVSLVRLAIYAAIVAGLVATGARLEHNRMQKKLDAKVAEHNKFVGGVEALGMEAAKDAANKDLWNALNKRKADDENARKRADDRRTIDGLRRDAAARDSRAGSGTENPRGSGCPEGQVCFDRAEYQRATGDFDREARRLADQCTALNTDLDTAIKWISGRAP